MSDMPASTIDTKLPPTIQIASPLCYVLTWFGAETQEETVRTRGISFWTRDTVIFIFNCLFLNTFENERWSIRSKTVNFIE